MLDKNQIDGKIIKDELGRNITLRKPEFMDRYRLLKAMGEDSQNPMLVNLMMPSIYIAKIDNEVFSTPLTNLQMELSGQKMKDEGSIAIIEYLNSLENNSEEEVKENIKK